MADHFLFNRRAGLERRRGSERRKNPRLDLTVRRRRKTDERRFARGVVSDFHLSRTPFQQQDKPRHKH